MTTTLKKSKITKFLHTLAFHANAFHSNSVLNKNSLLSIVSLAAAPTIAAFALSSGNDRGGVALFSLLASGFFVVGGNLLLQQASNQNKKLNKNLSFLNSDNFWLSKIKEISEHTDSTLRALPEKEIQNYKTKILAQIYILNKEVVSNDFIKRTLMYNPKFKNVLNLIKENLKISELDPVYQKNSSNSFFEENKITPEFEEAIKIELKNQQITLIDLAYDLLAIDRAHGTNDFRENVNKATLLKLVEISCSSGQALDRAQTLEMCGALSRIDNKKLVEQFIDQMMKSMQYGTQIDYQELTKFLTSKNSFSAIKASELMQQLSSISGQELTDSSVTQSAGAQTVKILETSETVVARDNLFFPQIFKSLESDKIKDVVNSFNFVEKNGDNYLGALQESLGELSKNMIFIENNQHHLNLESKIDIKLAINKTVPHLLNILKSSHVMDHSGQEQIVSMSASTFNFLNEQLNNAKQEIQNALIKDLSATHKHQGNRAQMSANGRSI